MAKTYSCRRNLHILAIGETYRNVVGETYRKATGVVVVGETYRKDARVVVVRAGIHVVGAWLKCYVARVYKATRANKELNVGNQNIPLLMKI